MRFCTQCGEKVADHVKFCTECGAELTIMTRTEGLEEGASSVNTSKTTQTVPADQQAPIQETRTTKKSSKKTKVFLSIIAILALILFGTHKFLSSYFDPLKDLKAMDQAISSNDQKTFFSYIEFEKDALLDKESYFKYIKEEEWDSAVKNNYMYMIEEQKHNPNPLDKVIESDSGHKLFTVKQKDILFGLYKGYTLHAVPIKLVAESDMAETEVKIGKKTKELKENKRTEVTKAYPGEYEVTGNTENEFGKFTENETINIEATDEYLVEINFDAVTYPVYYDSDYGNAELYINGKKTKKKLKDYEMIGPVPDDSDLKLHAQWKDPNGNIVQSNTVKLSEVIYDVDFIFDDTKLTSAEATELDDEMAGQFVLEFRDAYEYAVNYRDYNEIAPYLKQDSHAAKDLKNFINDIDEDDYYDYDFQENIILSIKKTGEGKYDVKTNELFSFTNDKYETTDYDREKVYKVEVNDGEYYITKIEYTDTKRKKR